MKKEGDVSPVRCPPWFNWNTSCSARCTAVCSCQGGFGSVQDLSLGEEEEEEEEEEETPEGVRESHADVACSQTEWWMGVRTDSETKLLALQYYYVAVQLLLFFFCCCFFFFFRKVVLSWSGKIWIRQRRNKLSFFLIFIPELFDYN